MKKVVLLPLDERPCNYNFPYEIFKGTEMEVVRPSMEIMGDKKKPGDIKEIKEFLLKETKDAYGCVIALDTLLYGGIVPSRLHFESEETLCERLSLLSELKKQNPNLVIYAYQLIMRCPQYNSSDEEPDYYDQYGLDLFRTGVYKHKEELGVLTPEEKSRWDQIEIPEEVMSVFLERRRINALMNIHALDYVEDKTIDFMIIPQDDSSEFGYTAMDQHKVRKIIYEKKIDFNCYMYPDADAVSNTLLSRMYLKMIGKTPLTYIRYATYNAGSLVPCLEDRILDTTVKYQILAAGGLVVDSAMEAEIILLVSIGTKMEPDPNRQKNMPISQCTYRNLVEAITYTEYQIQRNKPVMIADIAYLNGGDLDLIRLLESKGLSMKLASYAGWNTSSNTLGTTIPSGYVYLYNGDTKEHRSFLLARYLEDIGYCAYARSKVTHEDLKELKPEYNYFYVEDQRGIASQLVEKRIQEKMDECMPSIKGKYIIKDVYMPWRRMFEVGLVVESKE